MTRPTPRIMCIDDDQDILDVARMCLETVGGYEVFSCGSGPEALAQVRDIAPDLILLDVMMPGMDGPTVIKELHDIAEIAQTPIVFMTARVQPREVEVYLQKGAAAVIAKPFDPMTLSTQVGDILGKAQSA